MQRAQARALGVASAAPGYDLTRAAFDRDRHAGGGLLAGALAFRLFAALLPLALLATIALGYASTVDDSAAGDAGEQVGIRGELLNSFSQGASLSTGTRWTVAVAGVFALLWSAMSAARAIRAAHSLAWEGRVTPVKRPLHAGVALILAIVATFLVWGAVGYAREHLPASLGILTAFVALVPFFFIWLVLERLLPHADAPWKALIPGALLVAVGMEIIHLGTTLFLAGRIEHASKTYGSFGAALTLMVWLYIISRVIVGSAMLNASLWHRR
ncbi:YihY/virulence factor BrkB family protein [Solirubrobacter soli]|uniref:YihY/virulence factor BrkB family protein n=1 Tax=Solirubrobacter soli TaxID=363832 RepID=UPI00146AFD18|nr:YihY/virulence factor BrkB family protein [Solirubrobacter soli]